MPDLEGPIYVVGQEPKIDELEPGQVVLYIRFEAYVNDLSIPIDKRQREPWANVAGVLPSAAIAVRFAQQAGMFLTDLLDKVAVAKQSRDDARKGLPLYLDDGATIVVRKAEDA